MFFVQQCDSVRYTSTIVHLYDVLWAMYNFTQCNSNMSIEQCVKYNYTGCEIVQLVQLTRIVFYEGSAEWKAKVWQGDIILCLLAIMDIGVGINI